MREAVVRIALVALTLSAIALIASPGPSVQSSAPEGLQFSVKCTQTGAVSGGEGIGSVSCTLTVSGLPDPLEDQVSVKVLTAHDTGDAPDDSPLSDTVVASEAPTTTPGTPALLIRHLPLAPPPPAPITPQVPEQPPKPL